MTKNQTEEAETNGINLEDGEHFTSKYKGKGSNMMLQCNSSKRPDLILNTDHRDFECGRVSYKPLSGRQCAEKEPDLFIQNINYTRVTPMPRGVGSCASNILFHESSMIKNKSPVFPKIHIFGVKNDRSAGKDGREKVHGIHLQSCSFAYGLKSISSVICLPCSRFAYFIARKLNYYHQARETKATQGTTKETDSFSSESILSFDTPVFTEIKDKIDHLIYTFERLKAFITPKVGERKNRHSKLKRDKFGLRIFSSGPNYDSLEDISNLEKCIKIQLSLKSSVLRFLANSTLGEFCVFINSMQETIKRMSLIIFGDKFENVRLELVKFQISKTQANSSKTKVHEINENESSHAINTKDTAEYAEGSEADTNACRSEIAKKLSYQLFLKRQSRKSSASNHPIGRFKDNVVKYETSTENYSRRIVFFQQVSVTIEKWQYDIIPLLHQCIENPMIHQISSIEKGHSYNEKPINRPK